MVSSSSDPKIRSRNRVRELPRCPHRLRRLSSDTRAVVWTIEAVISLIVLFGVLVSVATSAPPATTSIDALDRVQLQQDAQDILAGAAVTDDLERALTYWDTSNEVWSNTEGEIGYYVSLEEYSTHPLHPVFEDLLGAADISYNIEIRYQEFDGSSSDPMRMVYQGVPGANAVVVTYPYVLRDDTPYSGLADPQQCSDLDGDGTLTLKEIDIQSDSTCSFYASDAAPEAGNDQFNIVKVRVIIWRN